MAMGTAPSCDGGRYHPTPMKIQNFGEWEGDRRGGHHPPACTCVVCTERRLGRGADEETHRAREYDRRVRQSRARGQGQRPPGDRPPQNRPPHTLSKVERDRPIGGSSSVLLFLGFWGVVAGLVAVILYVSNPTLFGSPQSGEPIAAVAALIPTEEPPANTPVLPPTPEPEPVVVPTPASSEPPEIIPSPSQPPTLIHSPTEPLPTTAATRVATPTRTPVLQVIRPRATLGYVPTPRPYSPPALIPTPVFVTATASTPVSIPTPTPVPTGAGGKRYVGGSPLDTKEVAAWVVEFTNRERTVAGLAPLSHDPAISDIARAHSDNMAVSGIFAHKIGGEGPTDRALAAGYDCRANLGGGRYSYGLSENILEYPRVQYWQGTTSRGKTEWRPTEYFEDAQQAAKSMVDGWMNSPGHRRKHLG